MEVEVIGWLGVLEDVGGGLVVGEVGGGIVVGPLGADVALFAHPGDGAIHAARTGGAIALVARNVEMEELSRMYSLFSTSRYAWSLAVGLNSKTLAPSSGLTPWTKRAICTSGLFTKSQCMRHSSNSLMYLRTLRRPYFRSIPQRRRWVMWCLGKYLSRKVRLMTAQVIEGSLRNVASITSFNQKILASLLSWVSA